MQVKKAYMKAVRIIHPDKIAGRLVCMCLLYYCVIVLCVCVCMSCGCYVSSVAGTDLYTRMLAGEAFIVLSQQYDNYRKQFGL